MCKLDSRPLPFANLFLPVLEIRSTFYFCIPNDYAEGNTDIKHDVLLVPCDTPVTPVFKRPHLLKWPRPFKWPKIDRLSDLTV
jgi:hypothetical protein